MCDELEIKNINDYESSDFSDLPTWRAMRNVACEFASENDIIVWVNSDIVFDDTLIHTINELKKSGLEDFILTGKRKNWPNFWKLNNKEEIRDGIQLTIPIDKNIFTVSIYNYSTPRYNPFPFN